MFTMQEFFTMIANYNTSYWPAALVAYALGIGAVVFALLRTENASRGATGVLVLFWLWTGVVFNGLVFSGLMRLAVGFAVLFVIQGILLTMTGVARSQLRFSATADVYGAVGGLAILYAMVGYPAIATLLGRGYPEALLVGMAPCPTVVFTLGMLLWSARPLPKVVMVIPVLYALSMGAMAATQGIVEDFGLVLVAVVAAGLLLYRDRSVERRLRMGTPSSA